jgi:hypothetical protein
MTNLELWNAITLGVAFVLTALLFYVWTAIALAAIFRKSGEESWKAWVPILNVVVLLRLGGLSGWLVLLFIIPIIGWIALIIAVYRINVAFGHGAGMTVLAWFLFPVWATVLGFGSARWLGREEAVRGPLRSSYADAPPSMRPADANPATTTFAPLVPPPAYGLPPAAATPPAPPSAPAFPAAAAPGLAAPAAPAPAAAPAPVAGSASPVPAAPAAGWTPPPLPPHAVRPEPVRSSQPAADLPAADLPGTDQVGADRSVPVDSTPTFADAPAPARPVFTAPALPAAPVADAPDDADDLDDEPGIAAPVSSAPRRSSAADAAAAMPDWDDDDDADAPGDEPSWDVDFGGASATGEVTDAVTGAPAPVSAAPRRAVPPADEPEPFSAAPRRAVPELDDSTDEPPVTSVPAAAPAAAMREPWAPAPSPMPGESEAFPETSGPVSAIAGAPDAGGPRSALASVSALHTRPHIPEDDEFDATIVARRKRTAWTLVDPTGTRIPLTSDVVLLGRRPSADPGFPGAQLVALDDDTRTISKTHARLQLRDDKWYITDLASTNGVLFSTLMGTEVAATPGEETEAGERFLLGDAEVSLSRSDA